MNNKLKFAGIVAISALTACGPDVASNTVSVSPASGPFVGDRFTVSKTAGGDIYVDFGGGGVTYPVTNPTDIPGFVRFADQAIGTDPNVVGYVVETADTVALVVGTNTAAPTPTIGIAYSGAAFARSTAAEVPTTGSATYSGNYAGLISDGAGVASVMSGNVALSANFAGSTVSGAISNREETSRDGTRGSISSPKSLDLAGIIGAAGNFSGTATGGEFADGTTTSGGQFVGMFGGDGGNEAVGAVTIEHQDGGTYTEVGVFFFFAD